MAMTQQEIINRIGKHFPGQAGVELVKVLSQMVADTASAAGGDTAAITALQTAVSNINTTWGTTFTKLNADFTAQNALAAFPLTLDVNYDTNPQA